MALTTTAFRTRYPEFADAAAYPEPLVADYLALAVNFVNEARWAELTDYGIGLWAAHNLVMAKQTQATAAAGGLPGSAAGVIASKSGGGLSVSYDVMLTSSDKAGPFNATHYGREFHRLSLQMGIGPYQVGTDGGQVPTSTGWPWSGPMW